MTNHVINLEDSTLAPSRDNAKNKKYSIIKTKRQFKDFGFICFRIYMGCVYMFPQIFSTQEHIYAMWKINLELPEF